MPNSNIAQMKKQAVAKKEERRARNQELVLNAVASRSQTSPIDLSEPHANTDFLDIPCTPVAPTTPAPAEQFETPAATLAEEGAADLPTRADDEADEGQGRPKRARKSTDIMNVGEFPTNFKRKFLFCCCCCFDREPG